ncbi:purple acid phosphatase 2 isoform X1 [Amborella trichopoda]|uniref:purple acid phosphatase 2 isoform X1 n=2 Tax=Amborella trichopoda TaxID=13333 RepID=UPI0009BEECB7|nr:purple acid phosphatase 2 isoform X1 [Amborella trichopoda]|eukprot:XP_020519977.1 purple acid phosphatase 2 isoform X1 [Amborella trichopoda]
MSATFRVGLNQRSHLLPLPCHGGVTSSYSRSPPSVDMPLTDEAFRPPPGFNAPEQVHITQGDHEGRAMIISWVTPLKPGPGKLVYGSAENKRMHMSRSNVYTYKFYNYKSGYIHHCTIKNLEYDTQYFYEILSETKNASRQFFFKTPPPTGPDVPYTFGVMGDLGQTLDSKNTLDHYNSNPKGQTMLFAGDLSYADDHPFHNNIRWDTWGRFVEKNAAYQPWIWTPGNHEIDFAPELGETVPFKPYKHRYHVPYKASNSTSPLWYSIKRASAYIIVLSSYSAYGKYTPQYQWLQEEFPKVNRSETPWVIVLLHSPWYNSLDYHYMEGESMRVAFESWFVKNRVDVVFAGHVHAYERSERISNIAYNITNGLSTPVKDNSAPVYITIGDGGNMEGIANRFTEPQPSYSAYREPSFGHSIFDIKNRTHAYYTWHRNQDGKAVAGDSAWFYNRYWNPVVEPSSG